MIFTRLLIEMTDSGFARGHGMHNDKRESYADLFQPYIYCRLAGKDLFYIVTEREMNQYDWLQLYDECGYKPKYLQYGKCRGIMWRHRVVAPMTVADARAVFPFD